MDQIELAELIALRIRADGPLTFDDLERRAVEKDIDMDMFFAAMELVNKRKDLHVSGTKYQKKVVSITTPISHTSWVTDNYPPMIPGVNDASHEAFAGLDFSFLFMKPEEAKEYKLSLKGGHAGRKNSTRHFKTPQKQGSFVLAQQQRGNLRQAP